MPKIIIIGSSNTDMVIRSGKLPAPGETILGGTFLMNPGGKGANQAVAAARLGGNVTFVTKTGNDIFGSEALQLFNKEGINTKYCITDNDNPSGVALINVDENGENSIVVASGSNGTLVPDDIDNDIFTTNHDDLFLMQLEIPLKTVLYTAKRAVDRGSKVILNPAPAQNLPDELFRCLYLITPNETEAELLTGIKVTDAGSAEKASLALINKGVQNVIITMGKSGAFLSTGPNSKVIRGIPVKAIDTTAAGDVFNGAVVVAVAEGKGLEEAIEFANKAAAISVTRMGAQASAPFKKEII